MFRKKNSSNTAIGVLRKNPVLKRPFPYVVVHSRRRNGGGFHIHYEIIHNHEISDNNSWRDSISESGKKEDVVKFRTEYLGDRKVSVVFKRK